MRRATRVTTLLTLVAVVVGAGTVASRAEAGSGPLRELVVPGVEYQAFTVPASHGAAGVHVVTARLDRAGVRAGLLHAGAVSARRPVSAMARDRGTVAAVNGEFFHLTVAGTPGCRPREHRRVPRSWTGCR
ncbi:hypothetical protein ACIRPK_34245 [Kitasatospora sp. NPDC101801]|uniref:hypothetical protein n=1 Tax=Kitasatospora sp. NPDC101801 TaxID=3364103 RepID=UPI0037F4EF76